MLTNIHVAVDGSPRAERALAQAIDPAEGSGMRALRPGSTSRHVLNAGPGRC